jgi:hypothetical protein
MPPSPPTPFSLSAGRRRTRPSSMADTLRPRSCPTSSCEPSRTRLSSISRRQLHELYCCAAAALGAARPCATPPGLLLLPVFWLPSVLCLFLLAPVLGVPPLQWAASTQRPVAGAAQLPRHYKTHRPCGRCELRGAASAGRRRCERATPAPIRGRPAAPAASRTETRPSAPRGQTTTARWAGLRQLGGRMEGAGGQGQSCHEVGRHAPPYSRPPQPLPPPPKKQHTHHTTSPPTTPTHLARCPCAARSRRAAPAARWAPASRRCTARSRACRGSRGTGW